MAENTPWYFWYEACACKFRSCCSSITAPDIDTATNWVLDTFSYPYSEGKGQFLPVEFWTWTVNARLKNVEQQSATTCIICNLNFFKIFQARVRFSKRSFDWLAFLLYLVRNTILKFSPGECHCFDFKYGTWSELKGTRRKTLVTGLATPFIPGLIQEIGVIRALLTPAYDSVHAPFYSC